MWSRVNSQTLQLEVSSAVHGCSHTQCRAEGESRHSLGPPLVKLATSWPPPSQPNTLGS